MNKVKNTSISYRKIIAISVIFIVILGISVIAGNVNFNNVKIRYSNNHEITILTSKTKVSEILEENHIMLSSDEIVVPDLEEEITDTKTIIITKIGEEPTKIAEIEENELENNIEEIADNRQDEMEQEEESQPTQLNPREIRSQKDQSINELNEAVMAAPEEAAKLLVSYIKD